MKPPLFIVGCPRSGTTLLYHMLLSSGGFVSFRKETFLYESIVPRFADLKTPESKREFVAEWLNSYFGDVPGYDVKPIIREAARECRHAGHFLRLLMDRIAALQGVDRWLEATPAHVTHIERIKRDFPDARFVHVIRDGRDSAISLDKQHWIAPFPWDRSRTLAVAALYWEWMVRRGRDSGQKIPADYLEIRYEDLVDREQETLAEVARFLDYDLDYERMRRTAMGTMRNPNTSFREKLTQGEFKPVGRWKVECSPEVIRTCERVIGGILEELGYRLSEPRQPASLRTLTMRAAYLPYFTAKRWLKTHTPLGRAMVDTSIWAAKPQKVAEGSRVAS